ncbi:hypothetical protein BKP42_63290 [Rhodococcus erythropolis]|nr:hypothetical protein BKP42_63290 [Rhodococcus erythropolis]
MSQTIDAAERGGAQHGENLEIELRTAGESVGVSVLCPGPVKTRMTESERNRSVDVESTSTDPLRQLVLDRLADTTATRSGSAGCRRSGS